MKHYITLTLSLLFFATIHGQYLDDRRYITVTGSADMSFSPDEITLSITLAEFYKNEDKMKNKMEMNKIEDKFFKALEENGISKDILVLSDGNYYWYYWWSNRRIQLSERIYSLSLDSNTDFMKLMQSLDIEGIKDLRIADKTHDKIHDYRVEVKTAAMKAAKKKANYMLESIDEKVGKVLSVDEINNRYSAPSRMISNTSIAIPTSKNGIEDVTKIKLRYEVKVKFAIL